MLEVLLDHYDDFRLVQILDAAKTTDSTKAIAIELENAYISLCQRSNPDIKFDHLGLNVKRDDLLGKPLFKTWYKFAKQKWSPKQVKNVVDDQFSDFDFAKMLDAAKKADSTKAIAIELEDAWISVWQGYTADFVFEIFGLRSTRNDLLGDPLFKIWYKFATKEWSPEEVMKFMRDYFGDFHFAKMLEAAKEADNTNAIAIKLEKAYILLWQRSDLRIVFHFFMRYEFTSDSLIGDYYFKTWYKFATQEGSPHKVMIILRDQFGDLSFAKMLDAAKEADSTKAIAIELEDAYILSWQGNTADFIFNHFDLKATRNDLVGSPLFKTWYKFATQKWSPEEVIMFLEKRLNELGLVQMLDAAKEADSTKAIAIELEDAYISLCQHSNPGIEFDELGLRATSDDLLGIPLFETWYKSATKEWSPIKVVIFLRARFGDFGFAAMLDAAKEADSTNAIAIELEEAYISLWQRSDPGIKLDHLGLDAKSDDLLGKPLFKTWYKFAKQKWSLEEVIMFLDDQFSDFDLAKMLDAAKKTDSTKAIAIELEDAWILPWPESQTVEIFDDLDLDAKSDDLLGNPLFKTWYKFATKKWSPLVVVKFLKGESDDFHYANMLDAATKIEDTEAIAIELLEALFDHWSQTGLSEAAVNEKMQPTRPISLLRKTELGQTVNVDDYSVWQKYLQWRYKNRIFDKAKDSAHAL